MVELAKILGNPLYLFNCSTSTNRETLVDIFRGLACSGEFITRFVSATDTILQINKTASALRKEQEINHILQKVMMRATTVTALSTLPPKEREAAESPSV